jgi:hypothetical protein
MLERWAIEILSSIERKKGRKDFVEHDLEQLVSTAHHLYTTVRAYCEGEKTSPSASGCLQALGTRQRHQ